MNTLKLIRNHADKLIPLAVSALNPPNTLVLARNVLARMQGQQWEDFVGRRGLSDATLATAGLNWMRHSQDVVGSGGVGCYEFYRWTTGYPEVTGYIIPTFWNAHHRFGDPEFRERAVRMANWELGIQRPEGGFEGFYEGDGQPPVVFNTGQVIRGLTRTFTETGDSRYLDAAVRAGRWIVAGQDEDGSWTSTNFKQMKRVYDSYVSAPLAELFQITGDDRFAESARRNCEFVLRHQHENGWFELCDNTLYNNEAPVTHTICYTIDGLIETGVRLGEPRFIAAGQHAAESLLHKSEILPTLPARLDKSWRGRANYVCNTGNAQLGIILMTLFERDGDPRYFNGALKLLDFLAYVQDLNGVGAHRRGGIAGSYPIWGMYCPLKYPSWATKYFVDFVMLVERNRARI
jgi:uncharacterized protein YyaL (SSP411 family)